jgi:hypothetical protein
MNAITAYALRMAFVGSSDGSRRLILAISSTYYLEVDTFYNRLSIFL